MDNNYYMTDIDPEIYLRIGQTLVKNIDNNQEHDYSTIVNVPTKSIKQYKEEYLQKLHRQIKMLFLEREELLYNYNLAIEFNKNSIEKINYLNKKLGNNNLNRYSNSTTNFISLITKKIKTNLNEAIENNIINSQKIYDIEKKLSLIELTINKTNEYIEKMNI